MIDQRRFSPVFSPFPDNLRVSSNPSPDEEIKSNTTKDRGAIFWRILKATFVVSVSTLLIVFLSPVFTWNVYSG